MPWNYSSKVFLGTTVLCLALLLATCDGTYTVTLSTEVMIPANDSAQLSVLYSWTPVDDNSDDIVYSIETELANGTEISNVTVTGTNMTTVSGLPSCEQLNATLVVFNTTDDSTIAMDSVTYTTTESATPMPMVTTSPSDVSCISSPSMVTLQCTWDNPAFYAAWYKGDSLIYSEDLAASTVSTPPPGGLSVVSSFSSQSSNLTISSSSTSDSGNYTCVVSCGAKDAAGLDSISSDLMSSIALSVYGTPAAPMNFTSVLATSDTNPVTVMFSWNGLSGEDDTGIPSNGDPSLNYTVSIEGTSTAVTTTLEMLSVENLTSCQDYNATLVANNKALGGNAASLMFSTNEEAPPTPVVTSTDPVNCTIATNNFTLTCSWTPGPVYYIAWFKDGSLLYSEDLANQNINMPPSRGTVSSSFSSRTSTLTIANSTFDDSGNYTCAVSCAAKNAADLESINSSLTANIEVLVFAPPGEPAAVGVALSYLEATISWTAPPFLGVPPPLSADGRVQYLLDVLREDTGESVLTGLLEVDHPMSSATVNLTAPCENYTVSIRTENKAGNSSTVTKTFTLEDNNTVSVAIDPPGPTVVNFTSSSFNIAIALNCSWTPRAFYLLWRKNDTNVFAVNLVTGVVDVNTTANPGLEVTYDNAESNSVLTIPDAFVDDSGTYTCVVTCAAERIVSGVLRLEDVSSRAAHSVLVQAVPEDLMLVQRGPTYIALSWTSPPAPYSDPFRVTYSSSGGQEMSNTTSMASFNLTGLTPFTTYTVQVSAGTGPPVLIIMSTLPSPTLAPGVVIDIAVLPGLKGDGTRTTATIVIGRVDFSSNPNSLSHIWIVCIRSTTPSGGNPDTLYPSSSSFRSYADSGTTNPYIAAEFRVNSDELPSQYVIGDPNQKNDRSNLYNNGPIDPEEPLVCFIRYFVSTELPTSGGSRRRRQAVGVRQYDLFVSSPFIEVSEPFARRALIAALVTVFLLLIIALAVTAVAVTLFCLYRRKYKSTGFTAPRPGSFRLRENIALTAVRGNDVVHNEARKPVNIKAFEKHVAQRYRNSEQLFAEEYELLSIKSPSLAHSVGSKECNVSKNRYGNIHSSDASRVVLNTVEGPPGFDYINANYIDGYKDPNAYIAAQGPMVNTSHDFWRMVWEQNSRTIVMVTNLVEKTRAKCHQYWPEPVGSAATMADLSVTLVEMQEMSDVVLRTFSISKDGERSHRLIQHIHYISWPDFGVPEQAIPILKLIERTESLNPPDAGPIVAHCSAGVGRTGSLICVANMVKMVEDVGKVDIFNSILLMRSQRTYMVQTEKQYVFVHEAVLEYLKVRGHSIPVRELKKRYALLREENPESGLNGLTEEYVKLESLDKVDGSLMMSATMPANLTKNRHKDSIPFDSHRVRLTMFPGVEGSDYINSTYLDGYQQRKQFILSQGPLEHTIFDFWRMVWETKSSAIVMLCDLSEDDYEQCTKYWPSSEEGVMQYGAFLIETESENTLPSGVVIREISLTNTKHYSERRMLKQFHMKEWAESTVPSSAANIIDLIGLVVKSQLQHGRGPVVMHDSGAVGRSASFCALCIILETMKSERIVDIFRTVRIMRLHQQRAVASPELYGFLYQVALEYLDSFDHYANFD